MDKESLSQKFIIRIIVAIILAWAIYWFLTFNSFQGWGERGQFGDMFGGLNALFSGLAFAGVIIAILLQKEELQLQREEMRRFAKAQEGSEEALKRQAEILQSTAKLNASSAFMDNWKDIIEAINHERNLLSGKMRDDLTNGMDENEAREKLESREKYLLKMSEELIVFKNDLLINFKQNMGV